jgi:predicted flavoprotein YhiN
MDGTSELSGLSFANVMLNDKFKDDIMFTHFGITGPGIFKLTQYPEPPKKIKIKFDVELDISEFKNIMNGSKKILSNQIDHLPKRYISYIENKYNLTDKKCCDYTKDELEKVYTELTEPTFDIVGFYDFDKAFTTGGGISTKSINPRTFESKKVPGLYFAGECLSANFPTGGFNLTCNISMAMSIAKN